VETIALKGAWQLVSAIDPTTHDLGGEPVPADLRLLDDRHTVAASERVSTACEQQRRSVDVQGLTGLDVTVVFDVDGVTQKGQAVPVVVLDVVTGVEEFS